MNDGESEIDVDEQREILVRLRIISENYREESGWSYV
jgi:hypothetical protein